MKPSTSTDIAICALLLALTPLLGACSQEDSPVYVIGPDGKPVLHTQQLSLASGKWVLPEIQDEDTLMFGPSEMGEEFRGGLIAFDDTSGLEELFGSGSAFPYSVSEELVHTGERYLKLAFKDHSIQMDLGEQVISNLEVVKKAGPDGIIARYQVKQSAEDTEAPRKFALRMRVYKR